MRRRSVRIDGRVTSIQIEDAFWALLKRQAATRGEPLAALLTRLRRQTPAGANFTSALRLACVAELQTDLARRQATLAALQAAGGQDDAVALLRMLAAPVLLLDAERVVLARSAGFLNWLGVPAAAVDGRPFDVLVARGARDGLQALWRRCQAQAEPAPVVDVVNLVVAGRLRIARLTLRRTSGGGAFALF